MNQMIRIIASAALLSSASTAALALEPLEVVLTNGCPTAVVSNQESCIPGQPDPANQACQVSNGAVRWESDKPIATIATKEGSAGALQTCQQLPNYYQCIVLGNQGDEVSYYVTLQDPNCASLDPIIIIK